MDAGNVTHIAAAKAKAGARGFSQVERDIACLKVSEARAVCRVVALATDALIDHAVVYRDPGAGRWNPAIECACQRLREVGSILGEVLDPPPADWWTPLNLLEAVGAALWRCADAGGGVVLEHDELAPFMRVTIAALDDLADELRNAGPGGQKE